MVGADRVKEVALQLQAKHPSPVVSVREFLGWFGVQRRGYAIVLSIRQALEEAGLRTEPDFESAFIDSNVSFVMDPDVATDQKVSILGAMSVTESPDIASFAASVKPPFNDATHRVSKLRSANTQLTTVSPDTLLKTAVTLMLMHDYSQLPVMIGERDVKGIISWVSIGTRLALDRKKESSGDDKVREFMEVDFHEVRSDASLFQVIPTIAQHDYVLVRDANNRITGIVTASDLSLQFQQLTEPFLLLGEIENQIRQIIDDRFSKDEMTSAREPSDAGRVVRTAADLSFGEYLRLLENPARWEKLRLSIDRVTFCAELDEVRRIRNEVMHFDPDGIPSEDLDSLRKMVRFFSGLRAIQVL